MPDLPYRTKLIEVSLPLDAINAAASREKSIRHGHPSTLHLWWARRPLAAARAVLFASLVDDPSALPEHFPTETEQEQERNRLFRLIEQLVIWENSTNETVLLAARTEIARSAARNHGIELAEVLTAAQVAETLATYAPPVLDPFAGGGSIPLEAQRLGLEAHASDLNPVAVLINKALIEIPPRFANQPPVNPEARQQLLGADWSGAHGLANDIRYYGKWMRDEAFKRIGHLYPTVTLPPEKGGGDATVIAWLWTRTITCPNPICHAQMPLVRSFALSTKKSKETYVSPVVDRTSRVPQISFDVKEGKPTSDGTVNRKGAHCLTCETPVSFDYIRNEGKAGRMSAQMMAIVAEGNKGRVYLAPSQEQFDITKGIEPVWKPDNPLPHNPRDFKTPNYGLTTFGDLFTSRQLVALATISDLITEAREKVLIDGSKEEYANAIATYLAFAVDRLADYSSTICSWNSGRDNIRNTFTRQALPMVWDFAETNIFSSSSGNFDGAIEWISKVIDVVPSTPSAVVQQQDATTSVNGIATPPIISTDPPYYDNIGYSDLADFFYIWLRRSLGTIYSDLFSTMLTPKAQELIATPYRFGGKKELAEQHFESGLLQVFKHIHQSQTVQYPLTVYYAFKQSENDESEDNESQQVASTGWEKMLESLVQSNFVVTGTWPMRTERGGRTNSNDANALASSIVLVCRPRSVSASTTTRRDFLSTLHRELPLALRNLQHGNIAPVDFAQAAIGPGMAVYSRYRMVTEPNGERLNVRTALQIINQELDSILAEQESEYDAETRFCVAWYGQFAFNEAAYGDAETLARAKDTAISTLVETNIYIARGGKARLTSREELPAVQKSEEYQQMTVWHILQLMARDLQDKGEPQAAIILRHAGSKGEIVRDLAYQLHALSERKGWASEALAYNSLVISWPEIVRNANAGKQGIQQASIADFT